MHVLLFCIFYLYIQIKIFPKNVLKLFFIKTTINQVKVKESNWSMYCTASNIFVSLTVEKVWMYCFLIGGQIHQQSRAAPCLSTHSTTALPQHAQQPCQIFIYSQNKYYALHIYWTICAFEENARLYCIEGRRHRKVKLRCSLHIFTWNDTLICSFTYVRYVLSVCKLKHTRFQMANHRPSYKSMCKHRPHPGPRTDQLPRETFHQLLAS